MTRKHTLDNVFLCFMILLDFAFLRKVQQTCPDTTQILYAYPDGDTKKFDDNYKPFFHTKIDLIDKFLTDDEEEELLCTWEIRARENHFAELVFQTFSLLKEKDSKLGDCLYIYDGSDASGKLLAELCGEDVPDSKPYKSSGRSLFVTFQRGEVYGHRHFTFKYFAVPYSKSMIIAIAAVASSVIAVVALCFLTIKFTHNCRPCRKKWCHDQPTVDQPDDRELRPLAPEDLMPHGVSNTREENLQSGFATTNPSSYSHGCNTNENGIGSSRIPGITQCLGSSNGIQNGRIPEMSEHGDGAGASPTPSIESDAGLHSPTANEPPPSYDSLFGENNNDKT